MGRPLGRLLTIWILSAVALTGCAHSTSQIVPDSALSNLNPAPEKMSPPLEISDNGQLDQTYMQAKADYHFALGESQSLEGNPQKAIEEFKHTLVYDPKSTLVRLRLASEYVKIGLLTEAVEQAEVAAKEAPKDTDALMLLGGLYSAIKMFDDAETAYKDILALDPKNQEARTYLAALYVEQGNYDKAKKEFLAVGELADNPEPHLAYFYLGRMLVEQGGEQGLVEAGKAFSQSLSLEPQHEESVIGLGSVYIQQKQEPKALQLLESFQDRFGPRRSISGLLSQHYLEREKYDQAIEQFSNLEGFDQNNLSVKIKIALILVEQKKFRSAVTKLEEVLSVVPENDKVRFYLGAVYEEMGEGERALEHYAVVPASSNFYQDAVVHSSYLLKKMNRVDDALAIVKTAAEKRDDVPQFVALYASMLDEKKDYGTAKIVLERGAKQFPDNTQIKFFLGSIYDRMGMTELVINEMEKILKLDPDHVQGLNYLAYTFAESGKNLDEAEALVARALKLQPKDAYILDTAGWVQFKKGHFEKALKYLEAAHKINSEESIIAEHLGDAYYRLQLVEKARVMYEKAASVEKDGNKISEIRSKIASIDERQASRSRQPASLPNAE